ncbi:MAG: hypothetical protein WCJ03_00330 [Bacteroidales bacterium]
MKFSERYGYEKPSDIIIRERITPEIQNAICSCYDILKREIGNKVYVEIDEYIWCYFLNLRKDKYNGYGNEITKYIENGIKFWFEKLDLVETTLGAINENPYSISFLDSFIDILNSEFERLKFGYRIVENQIVEITSAQEINTIESAIENNKDNVRLHLNNALMLYAKRPEADYRNSIKESITAVEALIREITGEKGLNFKKMDDKGVKIPNLIKQAFEKLYGYTNDPTTGIRHSLMDETGEFLPTADEALFMLITCSAFINYLNSKLT